MDLYCFVVLLDFFNCSFPANMDITLADKPQKLGRPTHWWSQGLKSWGTGHPRKRERRVMTANFDVDKNRPKLIGYHINVPWTTAKLM